MQQFLREMFVSILNMSAAGSVAIAAVLCVRALLHKAPRRAVCWLWAAPFLRLLCPVSVSSVLSVLPLAGGTVHSGRLEYIPSAVAGSPSPSQALPVSPSAAVPLPVLLPGSSSAGHLHTLLLVGGYVWLAGAAIMLAAAAVQLLLLRRRLAEAAAVEPGVFLADRIAGPFVLGVFFPRIYLPSHIPCSQRGYILAHERAHIRRRDPLFKLLAFFALCLHWFNPLVWAAWRILCRDIETACDEQALRGADARQRSCYAAVLLETAGKRQALPPLLAFGESDIAVRIKRTLGSRPATRTALLGTLALVLVFTACLATNPAPSPRQPSQAQAAAALEKDLGYTQERFAAFEIEDLSYIPPEDWEKTDILNESLNGAQTWGDCLHASPDRSLYFARVSMRYNPETSISGPQHPHGVWEFYLMLQPTGSEYQVCGRHVVSSSPAPDLPNAPTQSQLGLTDDQWLMLQHQLEALVYSGIWRDFSSPTEWTADELGQWLQYRRMYWPDQKPLFGTEPFPISSIDLLLMADFSPENSVWSQPVLRPAALAEETMVSLGTPPVLVQGVQTLVEYQRKDDTIVASAQITAGDGTQRQMEYTFGLVPEDTGPTSRTWLQQARCENQKCPVGESSAVLPAADAAGL